MTGALPRRPTVFLDRDGVVNEERGYITRPGELRLLPGVPEAIVRLNRSGYRVVVVTNQSIVARGGCTEERLAEIHETLTAMLAAHSAVLDGIYYCPHHPNPGPRGVAAFAINCNCRKPKIGLLERAASELNIDLSQSWMVGDASPDIEMARGAGLKSILVRQAGHCGGTRAISTGANFEVSGLSEAVAIVLGNEQGISTDD